MERKVKKERWVAELLNVAKWALTKQAKRQIKKYFNKT